MFFYFRSSKRHLNTSHLPENLWRWCRSFSERRADLEGLRRLPRVRRVRQRNRVLEVRYILQAGMYKLLLEERISSTSETADPISHLTPREREVFHWLVEGKSDREIATILSEREPVSVRTIEAHVRSLLEKLNLENRRFVMRWYLERRRE